VELADVLCGIDGSVVTGVIGDVGVAACSAAGDGFGSVGKAECGDGLVSAVDPVDSVTLDRSLLAFFALICL
jgi:hypothetical protein